MTPHEALCLLHEGLAQQGPGNDDATLAALGQLLGEPPSAWIAERSRAGASPVVFDLGCGAGRQTIAIARALATPIAAIDQHQPFLDQLAARAAEAGVARLIAPRIGDIGQLDLPERSVDLIWSEGAAYTIGLDRALHAWGALLKPGGRMAISECSWLIDDPSDAPRAFWQAAYPAMRCRAENIAAARNEGLDVLGEFVLPQECWLDDYYAPLEDRMDQLSQTDDADDEAMAAVIAETRDQIDLYRRFGDSYGYVFYLLEKRAA